MGYPSHLSPSGILNYIIVSSTGRERTLQRKIELVAKVLEARYRIGLLKNLDLDQTTNV